MRRYLIAALTLMLLMLIPSVAAEDRALELIRKMDYIMRGVESSFGTFTMTIEKQRWKKPRLIKMKSWDKRETEKEPAKSFILIAEPVSEAGKAFLKIGNEMWSYFPDVNAITKIPPSMMFQDWMGSDFTNDDLVRESSVINDYTHRITGTHKEAGQLIDVIELIPKPEAPVTWGKVIAEVRDSDGMPVRQEYFNDKGEKVRTMSFLDIRQMGGKIIPTKWIMKPEGKPGDQTMFVIDSIEFNVKINPKIFSMAHLRQGGM